jgi:hypothetical protein
VHGQRDEPGLRAVVQVALDPAKLGGRGVDRGGARLDQLLDPRAELGGGGGGEQPPRQPGLAQLVPAGEEVGRDEDHGAHPDRDERPREAGDRQRLEGQVGAGREQPVEDRREQALQAGRPQAPHEHRGKRAQPVGEQPRRVAPERGVRE